MGYDGGDSFPFDFKPDGFLFGLKYKGKLFHHHIPFNMKGNGNIVFSVYQRNSISASNHSPTLAICLE